MGMKEEATTAAQRRGDNYINDFFFPDLTVIAYHFNDMPCYLFNTTQPAHCAAVVSLYLLIFSNHSSLNML